MIGDGSPERVVGARFDEQVQVVGAELNATPRLQLARQAAIEISESRQVAPQVQTEIDSYP